MVMANGQLKVIKDIVVGERVLGQDGTHNVVTGIERVTLELLSKVGDAGFRRRVRLAFLRP